METPSFNKGNLTSGFNIGWHMKIGGKPISFSSYSLYLDIIFFSLLN